MDQANFRTYSRLSQLGLWLIFFLIYFLEELNYSSAGLSFVYAGSFAILHAVPVYVHYYLLLPLLRQGKRWQYGTASIVLLFSTSVILRGIETALPYTYPYDYPFLPDVSYNLLLLLLVVAVSSLYYFVEAWITNIQTQSLLRNEKLHAELSFLKSQINPHFLFNTLNNIYSYVQTNNEKAAPMLERLSSILRFIVYDGQEDRVMLMKELDTVEDLIEMYRMKNPELNNIRLHIEGVKGYHLIPPLLLINIVENACKHSDATSNPDGFIQIEMKLGDGDRFHMEVVNSVKDRIPKDPDYQGVGLENLKRRLNLLYPDAYVLEEKLEQDHYQLNLSLPLERKE
ncbi:MAG: histidine kinase [Bacteroidota bacterium]